MTYALITAFLLLMLLMLQSETGDDYPLKGHSAEYSWCSMTPSHSLILLLEPKK